MKPFALVILAAVLFPTGGEAADQPRQFNVWATSCAHVPADIRRGRESLARVIRQSEGNEPGAPAFDWDINIDAGDLSAHQQPPGDRDGQELIRQYRALKNHRREQVYNVPGNHDAPYYDHVPGSWIRKWGDPLGENTLFSGVDPKRRPFPVSGNWERYSFQAGNILFLMLADRNDAPEPVGRGHSRNGKSGGYPSGAVTRDTFEWWKKMVLENQDKLIVTMHHHVLRDTTTASGYGEGNPRYHGSTGGKEGGSYLYYIIENEDPDHFEYTTDGHVFEDFLDNFHQEHGRGAIDFWIGGHTHVKGPDDDFGGKTISERKWGVGFLQCAALTVHHGGSFPLSRLLTFTEGSEESEIQTYLHEADYKKNPIGFYEPAKRTFPLRHKFSAPPPIEPMAPFPAETRIFDDPYLHQPATPTGKSHQAKPSPDLLENWDQQQGGPLHLEDIVAADNTDKIGNKPSLAHDAPEPGGHSLAFDGSQRLRVGPLDTSTWTGLTVSAWIKTKKNTPGMRIVSKDSIGAPGCFVLIQNSAGVWTFRVYDKKAEVWQSATWRSNKLSDGHWHQLTGIVDPAAKEVQLHVDGRKVASAPWTAPTLDDSDHEDLVLGADSGRKQFNQTFQGQIHDVRIFPLRK